jgi:hypothetical protein
MGDKLALAAALCFLGIGALAEDVSKRAPDGHGPAVPPDVSTEPAIDRPIPIRVWAPPVSDPAPVVVTPPPNVVVITVFPPAPRSRAYPGGPVYRRRH